jgi:nucleotide-binding universal stress UspA family protein
MLPSRRRWDTQPSEPAAVLLASSGAPFSRAAARRAHELAAGQPVAVISILKVYGSAFGLPNPGLMPSRREREEQVRIVDGAIRQLERLGCPVDGQVTATRSAGRAIAKAARARQVSYVVMDAQPATGAAVVRRWLRGAAELDLVSVQKLLAKRQALLPAIPAPVGELTPATGRKSPATSLATMDATTPPAEDLRLIVGYDGSPPATRALDAAIRLLQGRTGRIDVVYVGHIPSIDMLSAGAIAEVESDFGQIAEDLRK